LLLTLIYTIGKAGGEATIKSNIGRPKNKVAKKLCSLLRPMLVKDRRAKINKTKTREKNELLKNIIPFNDLSFSINFFRWG
jgi:hypothetical protein